jgi:hypothetical protein
MDGKQSPVGEVLNNPTPVSDPIFPYSKALVDESCES